jgi:hypothetical protein
LGASSSGMARCASVPCAHTESRVATTTAHTRVRTAQSGATRAAGVCSGQLRAATGAGTGPLRCGCTDGTSAHTQTLQHRCTNMQRTCERHREDDAAAKTSSEAWRSCTQTISGRYWSARVQKARCPLPNTGGSPWWRGLRCVPPPRRCIRASAMGSDSGGGDVWSGGGGGAVYWRGFAINHGTTVQWPFRHGWCRGTSQFRCMGCGSVGNTNCLLSCGGARSRPRLSVPSPPVPRES